MGWILVPTAPFLAAVMLKTKRLLIGVAGRTAVGILLLCLIGLPGAVASQHYTDQQLDALASRIGKTYWTIIANGRTASFLSAPAEKAPSFQLEANTSFEITEMLGRKTKAPYYKVKFNSAKVGYIRPEGFLQELNLTIVATDPLADEKRKQAERTREEEKRIAWIQGQPWPPAVKEAAIKRQPVPGMKTDEIKKVIGHPAHINRIKRPQAAMEERWLYKDGSVLVFENGLLIRVEPSPRQER